MIVPIRPFIKDGFEKIQPVLSVHIHRTHSHGGNLFPNDTSSVANFPAVTNRRSRLDRVENQTASRFRHERNSTIGPRNDRLIISSPPIRKRLRAHPP